MASTSEDMLPTRFPFRVSSPYLKNPSAAATTSDATTATNNSSNSYESNRREFRKSLERIERINMNDLEPFKQSKPDAAELRGFSKRQNRLSREILGVDDPILSAPDNAPTRTTTSLQPNKQQSHEQNQKNLAVHVNSNSEFDEDASSVGDMAGSVTSTVPDKYGFVGGNQYTHYGDTERNPVAIAVLRRRELKWLQMLEEWDKYMKDKYKKVRDRCRKGVPSSVRSRAWQYLCGGNYLMSQNKGIFDELLEQPGDPKWLDDIRKDLHRQFPNHEMFTESNGPGQVELFRVLKAYSILNPVDGYFQGQAPVAAMLVMHMPAEEAFWCLVAICERYLPGYYSQGLEAVQVDGDILVRLLRRVSPSVHRHLTKQKLDPVLFMMEWFMCIYTRTLPWASVLRVWDMFFCEGVKVLFRVGLVILKHSFAKSKTIKDCPTMYESMEVLRHLEPTVTDENLLVSRMLKLPISEEDMEKAHTKVVERRKLAAAEKARAKGSNSNP